MKMLRVIGVASGLACVSACGSSTSESLTPPIIGLRVEFSPGSKVLVFDSAGVRVKLQAYAIGPGGVAMAPPSPVTFMSRDSAVATVDVNGQVTTVSKGNTWVIGVLAAAGQEFKDSVQIVYGEVHLAFTDRQSRMAAFSLSESRKHL